MKKNLLLVFLAVLAINVYAQQPKTETFDNVPPADAFFTGTYTGNHGISWTINAGRRSTQDGPAYGLSQANSSSITSGTISGGIGDFRVQLENIFSSDSNPITVEVFINGNSVGTNTNTSGRVDYFYTIPNINVAGDFTISIEATSPITGRTVDVDNITWTPNNVTLGVNDVEANTTNVYPNPFSNEINIQGADNVKQAELYNVSGQKVLNAQGNSTINVDAALPKGVYFLRLSGDNGFQETHKLIKE